MIKSTDQLKISEISTKISIYKVRNCKGNQKGMVTQCEKMLLDSSA